MPSVTLGLDEIWDFLRTRMLARGGVSEELDRAAARAKRNLVRAKRAHGAAWRNDMTKVTAVHMWLRDIASYTGVTYADVADDVRVLVAGASKPAASA
jgi:hypothetical protein